MCKLFHHIKLFVLQACMVMRAVFNLYSIKMFIKHLDTMLYSSCYIETHILSRNRENYVLVLCLSNIPTVFRQNQYKSLCGDFCVFSDLNIVDLRSTVISQ